MIQLLDDPCEAAGWTAPIRKETWEANSSRTREESANAGEGVKASGLKLDPETTKAALIAGLERLIAAEPDVTKYDTVVGDGDCGYTLRDGAKPGRCGYHAFDR